MRVLDKFISFIFSLVIIVLAVSVILVSTSVVKYTVVDGILTNYVFSETHKLTTILVSILFVLAGLKVTVFSSSLSSGRRKNIYVNTPNGKIQIAQETIEGIAQNVITNYNDVKDVKTAMTKTGKGINLYMGLTMYQNSNITETISKIQEEVKSQIDNITGVKVYNVDVKVRNVVTAPVKGTYSKTVGQSKIDVNKNIENKVILDSTPIETSKIAGDESTAISTQNVETSKKESDTVQDANSNGDTGNNM